MSKSALEQKDTPITRWSAHKVEEPKCSLFNETDREITIG